MKMRLNNNTDRWLVMFYQCSRLQQNVKRTVCEFEVLLGFKASKAKGASAGGASAPARTAAVVQ